MSGFKLSLAMSQALYLVLSQALSKRLTVCVFVSRAQELDYFRVHNASMYIYKYNIYLKIFKEKERTLTCPTNDIN